MKATQSTQNSETVSLLIFQALKLYESKYLFPFLEDRHKLIRYAAARELQMRGGQDVFDYALILSNDSKAYKREIGIFLLSQLGTPKYPFKKATTPIIQKAFSDKSYTVRATAVSAVGHLNLEILVNDLIALSVDQSACVRASVAAVLMQFTSLPAVKSCLRNLKKDTSQEVRFWAND